MNPIKTFYVSLFVMIGLVSPISGQAPRKLPMDVYMVDFGSNPKDDLGRLASDLTAAIEAAFSQHSEVFNFVERRNLNEVLLQKQAEADARGRQQKPAQGSNEIKEATGYIRGVLAKRSEGVQLTVSLTLLNSAKIWTPAAVMHTEHEWLGSELQRKVAEELAAKAVAFLKPAAPQPPKGEDGTRGMDLAKAGHFAEAIPFLQSATLVETDNAELYFWLGSCQNQTGDFESASRSLKSAISRNPKRADLFTERARSFIGQKLYSRANEDLDRSLKLDPRNVPSIELRGEVAMLTGRYSDAVTAFDEVYQLDATKAHCLKLAEAHKKNGASNPALERSCAALP
jgi:tetratricopeptide (TPR) repeat protein